MMKRSSFHSRIILCLSVTLLLGFTQATVSGSQTGKRKERPNVLFIAIDDLNDWVGVMGGHPQAITPNLDKFAKSGILFKRAYCSAPACNPSRASLLSGLRPSTTGVYHNPQPWRPVMPQVVTLPDLLRRSGYHVWGGGKIFHGSFPDTKAWDEYFKGSNKFKNNVLPPNGIGGNMRWGPIDVEDEDMPDTQMTDWAIDKLKKKHEQPFFLAVGYIKPHLTWHAPKKYFDMHPLDKVKLPKVNKSDLNDIPPSGIKMAKPGGDHKKITKKGVWKEAVQAYLATSTYMDAQLGRLLQALEDSEYADNTIVIIWSDHGWHLGEKEHWRKFALWEEAARVVMMARAPGMTPPGRECQRTVTLLDIYPTVVELCDVQPKGKLEGHSLVPLLKNPDAEWKHPAITTHGRNNHAVRTERWRYIHYANGEEELYDHDNDPMEWKNLAGDPKFANIKKELSQHFPKVNVPDAPRSKPKKGKKKKKKKAEIIFPDRNPNLRPIQFPNRTAFRRGSFYNTPMFTHLPMAVEPLSMRERG